MPSHCSVAGCTVVNGKTDGEHVSFHRFPRKQSLRKIWIKRCSRADVINVKNAKICSRHFEAGCFIRDLRNELLGLPIRRMLREDAVPTIHLPNAKSQVLSQKSAERQLRAQKRRDKALINELLHNEENVNVLTTEPCDTSESNVHKGNPPVHEEDSGCICCKELKQKYDELQTECRRLQQKIKLMKTQHMSDKHNLNFRINYWKQLNKCQQISINKEDKKLVEIVRNIFSAGQIRCLIQGKTSAHWSKEDMLQALELQSVSHKAYDYLRKVKHFPLPGLSTLKRWVSVESTLELDYCSTWKCIQLVCVWLKMLCILG